MTHNFSDESRLDFWRRADNLPTHEGPFKAEYDQLIASIESSPAALHKESLDGDAAVATNILSFQLDPGTNKSASYHSTKRTMAQICAYTTANKDVFGQQQTKLLLAIDPDTSNSDMLRLQLSPDGLITNIDNPTQTFGDSDMDKNLLATCIARLGDELHTQQRDYEQQKAERKARLVKAGSAIAIVGALGAGTFFGIKHWYFEPKARAEAARTAYDNAHHVLSGTSVASAGTKVATLPKQSFENIPDLRDGDSLLSPRVIEVYGNDCAELTGDFTENFHLVAALKSGDPLEGSNVGVVTDPKGTRIEICLVGQKSPVDSDNDAKSSQLAIQLRPLSEK